MIIQKRPKLTRINTELLEQLRSFHIKPDGESNGHAIITHNRIDITSLIKILYPIRYGSLTFSELYRKSDISHYKTYQRYLRFCHGTGLVTKQNKDKQQVSYFITVKGTALLGVFLS